MANELEHFRKMGLHYAETEEVTAGVDPLHTKLTGIALIQAHSACTAKEKSFAIGCAIGNTQNGFHRVIGRGRHNAFSSARGAFVEEAEVDALMDFDEKFMTSHLKDNTNMGATLFSTLEPTPGAVQSIGTFLRPRPRGLITSAVFGAPDPEAANIHSEDNGGITKEMKRILEAQALGESFTQASIPADLAQACDDIFMQTFEEVQAAMERRRETFYD